MKKLLLSVAVLTAGVYAHAVGARPQDGDSIRTYQMNEVVVNASRSGTLLKSIPQKVEIISGSTLKTLPNDNLAEVLKRATNLDIIQYPGLSAGIGMRGLAPSINNRNSVLILINGVSAGTTNLASITVDNIERIEVVKGPYAVLYGSDAMGGVINIITKKNVTKSQGNVSVESGSFGYSKLAGNFTGVSSINLTYGLGYNHQEQSKDYRIGTHNLLNTTAYDAKILGSNSYGDAMQNTQYDLSAVNAFAEYSLDKQWKVRAEGIYTFAYDVETPGDYFGSSDPSKKDINRLNTYLSLEQNGVKNHFRFAPYYTNDKNSYYSANTTAGFIDYAQTVKEYGYQLQDNYKFGDLNLLAGQDMKIHNEASNVYSAKGVTGTPYNPDNSITDVALFAQASYSLQNLNVNAGIRYDHFNYHIDANSNLNATAATVSYNTVNPSIGAQYTFQKDFRAHASYGTAFHVPDPFQVAGQYTNSWGSQYVGNPDLKPEKSRTTDFGLAYSSEHTGLKIDVSYFHTYYDNKIVTAYGVSTTYVNANHSLINGLELSSAFNFGKYICPKLNLEAYANFTWLLRDNVTTSSTTQDALNVRKVNGNFGLNYQGNKISMRLNGRLIGSRLENDYLMNWSTYSSLRGFTVADYYTKGGYSASDQVLQIPGFLIFDYSIGYAYSKKVNFGITVSNLLDENYTEKDGYNMPGRSIVAKLSYAF